jgi:OmcA/MtrC family decaheme c-type cytochrome
VKQWKRYIRGAAIALAIVISLTGQTKKNHYTPQQKAYYADATTLDFVNSGLTITANSATISSKGVISVTYTLTDPTGLGLDVTGATTPGAVSVSFVAAVLPHGSFDYTTYTTSAATGPVLASTLQPGADSGGTTTSLGNGQYTYTFGTAAPAGFDATATHTIGIYGSRNLTAFNILFSGGTTNYASTTYNFVPNGTKVAYVDDQIETTSCNRCHDQLSAHGGSRRGLDMCVLCHNPGNLDPNTGATFDAKVFFHRIHMGASLPSVVAGGTFEVTNTHGTFNYSTVVYPATPADPRDCETCHSQAKSAPATSTTPAVVGATNPTVFLTNPTMAACGSCHDNVNFTTGANHPGGPQFDNTQCATCHQPQGTDFDASILGAHVVPTSSSLLSGLVVNITKVQNGTAGSAPVVSFTVHNSAGAGVPLAQLGSISLTMAGPTSDYGYTIFGTNTSTPGYVTESAAKATCDSTGACQYTFTNIVPPAATGSYAIGIEARETQVLNTDTAGTQSIEYGAPNVVSYFSVDGSPVTPRRSVVALANCNNCHQTLQVHGALRNNTEYCVLCHNPSNTDATTRATATVAADKAAPPQGINFNLLVHRIHYGINMLAANRTYIVVGFGGSHNDFSGTLFPPLSPTGTATDTKNCSMCHLNSSEQADVTLTGLNPVTDPQGPINPVQPISAACSGCHVDLASAAHFLDNTATLGGRQIEACPVCHSSGAAYAVDAVHAQY